jgi:hypothetical protein
MTGFAFAESSSLEANLKNWMELAHPQLISKLEEFRDGLSQTADDKKRAAYVLARLLQKDLPTSIFPSQSTAIANS